MDGKSRKYYSIWIGLLTFSAGLTNGEAAWGAGLAVSHHTGNLTQLKLAFKQDLSFGILFLCLLLSFFAGSVLAGFIFYKKKIGTSPVYGYFSLVQGVLTIALSLLLSPSWIYGFYLFAALSLGMQNGILMNHRGILVRTTHMTGYMTDAGVALGQSLRRDKKELWKFRYFGIHLLIFVAGALMGVAAGEVLGLYALPLTGAVQILTGMVYLFRPENTL